MSAPNTKNTASLIKHTLVSARPMTTKRWLVDAVIAAGAFGFGMLQMTLSVNLFLPDEFTRMMLGIQSVTPSGLAITGVLFTCAPLVVRERVPWPSYALCLLFWVIFTPLLQISTLSLVGPLVALFTVTYERSRTESIVAGAVMLVAVLATPLLIPELRSPFTNLMLLQNATLVAAVALAGYAFHIRQDYLQAAEARAHQAEQLQEVERLRAEEAVRTTKAEAQQRMEAERVRIAREVHDITAHSLSAVSIQAAAAMRLLETDPVSTKAALETIRTTSKDALGELRAMIGVLRDGTDAMAGAAEPETEPTRGTESLGDLLNFLEAAGVRAEVDELHYFRSQVPAYIDVALFGIAREATTNIVRHANATQARVVLTLANDRATLEVTDNGRGVAAPAAGASVPGHGVAGMRERVHVLGGLFQAGARMATEGGGFRVYASIPLTAPAAPVPPSAAEPEAQNVREVAGSQPTAKRVGK